MKKVSIVSEKNEKEQYEIRTIVIFDEDKVPVVINYDGVHNLIAVVNFCEKNGHDILGNDGIRPAIESGLIEVISKSNNKSMSELKAQLLKEQLSYVQIATVDKEDEKEEQEDNIIEKSHFESLSEEDREYAEYLNIDILRTKGNLSSTNLKRLNELKDKNVRVAEMEKARQDVVNAIKHADSIKEDDIEASAKAKEDLDNKKNAYMALRAKNRKQLADAIKSARRTPDKKEEIVKTDEDFEEKKEEDKNPHELTEENREYAEYLKLNLLRAKQQISSKDLDRIEELKKKNKRVESVEKSREEVIEALRKVEVLKEPKNEKEEKELEEAENELNQKKEKYKQLHASYRKELADKVHTYHEKREDNKELALRLDNNKEMSEDLSEPKNLIIESEDKVGETNERRISPFSSRNKVIKFVSSFKFEDEPENDKNKPNENMPETEVTLVEDGRGEPEYTNGETENNGFILVRDGERRNVSGSIPFEGEEEQLRVPSENDGEQDVKIRKGAKEKDLFVRFISGFLGAAAGVAAPFGMHSLVHNEENNIAYPNEIQKPVVTEMVVTNTPNVTSTLEPIVTSGLTGNNRDVVTAGTQNPNVTQTPRVTVIDKRALVIGTMQSFFNEYNVPNKTRTFINRHEIVEFLMQYNNESQIKEVLSALAYGYEVNILTTENGNFRLNQDGINYLTFFTHDFFCAKSVVNNYNAREMMAIFGGSNISYEELMSGFQNYCYTLTTYGMNAKETLPFRYLTNNNIHSTEFLSDLFEKLTVVNRNRVNGTLTSEHTDHFVALVYDNYVSDNKYVTPGTKAVGANIVKAYTRMQAQISDAEPLYLHSDYGRAKAGTNLNESNGYFALDCPHRTSYHFASIVDVVNNTRHANEEDVNSCLTQQQQLKSALIQMSSLENSNVAYARVQLGNALYINKMETYADLVYANKVNENLLTIILNENPMLEDEVNNYVSALSNQHPEYVSFETTVANIDRIVGISNRSENNYSNLINNRRDTYYLSDSYRVVNGNAYRKVSQATATPTVEPMETHEQELTFDQLITELREGVINGLSQEELEAIARRYGVEINPNYRAEMLAALELQRQGEEKRQQEEQINLSKEADEAEAVLEIEATEQPVQIIDQTDPNRVDTTIDEQPYQGLVRDELEVLRRTAMILETELDNMENNRARVKKL